MAAPETPGGGAPRPGVRQQFGNTRRAAKALATSHVALARAELGDILGLAKTLGIIGGVALGVALFTGTLAYTGAWLFLGEWLFGSIGWGLAHGVLFGVGILVMLGLLFVGAGAGSSVRAFLISAVIGVLVALLLGSNVIPNAVRQLTAGTTLPFDLPPTLWLGPIIGLVVFALIGLLMGARMAGAKGAIGGLLAGAIVGLALGLLFGRHHSWRVAIAAGIAVALLLWSVLQALFARDRIDMGARFAGLKPTETIETAKETKEWLGQQWANRRSKLGRR